MAYDKIHILMCDNSWVTEEIDLIFFFLSIFSFASSHVPYNLQNLPPASAANWLCVPKSS